MGRVPDWMASEPVKILLVLCLSFLMGLEREEHMVGEGHRGFGGVRTFPLIGMIGFSIASLSGGELLPVTVGFAVVGAFLWLSYQHKIASSEEAGVTSEMSGLTTYLVGALVYRQYYWLAIAMSVAGALLLELKEDLESLGRRFSAREMLSLTQFLLLSAVILPTLPNRAYGALQINPFKAWLVVVAVSAVSYASYLLQKLTRERGGVLLAALLGGAYSSTVTTVVLSKRAATENRPNLFAGAVLMASGMMYLRLALLLGLFNRALFFRLAAPFVGLFVLATVIGGFESRRSDSAGGDPTEIIESKNPLELRAALLFGIIFLVALAATRLTVLYLGHAGVYALAGIMGLADVDPFIMGLTQSAGRWTSVPVAAMAIVIAAASNNGIKGVYAFCLSDRPTGIRSLAGLIGLAIVGLAPLLWLAR